MSWITGHSRAGFPECDNYTAISKRDVLALGERRSVFTNERVMMSATHPPMPNSKRKKQARCRLRMLSVRLCMSELFQGQVWVMKQRVDNSPTLRGWGDATGSEWEESLEEAGAALHRC